MLTACLGHAKLSFIPWHFQMDDSLLMRGNVEGYCGRLCLHPDCLLAAVGSFSCGMVLAMHVSGEFVKRLVVSGTVACIRLF